MRMDYNCCLPHYYTEILGLTIHFPSVEEALFFAEAPPDPTSPQKQVPVGLSVPQILFVDFLVRPGCELNRFVPYLDRTETRPTFVTGEKMVLLQKLYMKKTDWNQNGRQVELMTGGRRLAMVHSKRLGKLVAGDERGWRVEMVGTNSSKQRQRRGKANSYYQLIIILHNSLYSYSSMGHYCSHTKHLHIYSEITGRGGRGKPTQSQEIKLCFYVQGMYQQRPMLCFNVMCSDKCTVYHSLQPYATVLEKE